jgi:hypothetical protein
MKHRKHNTTKKNKNNARISKRMSTMQRGEKSKSNKERWKEREQHRKVKRVREKNTKKNLLVLKGPDGKNVAGDRKKKWQVPERVMISSMVGRQYVGSNHCVWMDVFKLPLSDYIWLPWSIIMDVTAVLGTKP